MDQQQQKTKASAIAVFKSGASVKGEVLFYKRTNGVVVNAEFTHLPPGEHGFHIHKAGDLRGDGCKGACDHWHKGGVSTHGGPPGSSGPRHTGDLGNIELPADKDSVAFEYFLRGVTIDDLLGRSLIVHQDKDDLGRGPFEDSLTTGHSGARIACAIIGRAMGCDSVSKKGTRKR